MNPVNGGMDNGYCVIGVYWTHSPDKLQLLTVKNKVIVFDAIVTAKDCLMRLAGGRQTFTTSDGETVAYLPLSQTGFNRASILTGYDPYDTPAGLDDKLIRSEARQLDWRHHILWTNEYDAIRTFADKYGEEAFNDPVNASEAINK